MRHPDIEVAETAGACRDEEEGMGVGREAGVGVEGAGIYERAEIDRVGPLGAGEAIGLEHESHRIGFCPARQQQEERSEGDAEAMCGCHWDVLEREAVQLYRRDSMPGWYSDRIRCARNTDRKSVV